ncbi:MAG: hypothetical protein ACRDHZ_00350 [Ktedonobacteraceae bacterium]
MKTHERVMQVIQSRFFWLALLAAVLVLFPFDWLSEIWPAFGSIFDRVFVSAREHEIGHTTVFLLAGLLVLCAVPGLRRHPLFYALIMAVGSVGEEAFQALSKWQLPNLGDGRDLSFDALGFVLAYVLIWVWWWLRHAQSRSKKTTLPIAR